ncbi:hypothetical protein EIP91_007361 [Steccherinum ochraceum]|uniref:Uncharacterized protein n=1 Tax=Steccherinum ochraceum TaxID=92696 RepID=A0A4R0S400_9APHY|nr:hypothetical protein EIP91_007361 [Steccherinum ochraceum]
MRFTAVFVTLVTLAVSGALAAPTAVDSREIQAAASGGDNVSHLSFRDIIDALEARETELTLARRGESLRRDVIYRKREVRPPPQHQPPPPPPPQQPAQNPPGNPAHMPGAVPIQTAQQPQQPHVVTNNPAGGVQPQQGQTGTWPGRRDIFRRKQVNPPPQHQPPPPPPPPQQPAQNPPGNPAHMPAAVPIQTAQQPQQPHVVTNNPAGGVQPQQGQTGTWPGRRALEDGRE